MIGKNNNQGNNTKDMIVAEEFISFSSGYYSGCFGNVIKADGIYSFTNGEVSSYSEYIQVTSSGNDLITINIKKDGYFTIAHITKNQNSTITKNLKFQEWLEKGTVFNYGSFAGGGNIKADLGIVCYGEKIKE